MIYFFQAAISQINSSPHSLLPPNTVFKVQVLQTNGSSFHLLKNVCSMLEGHPSSQGGGGGLHIIFGPSDKKLRDTHIHFVVIFWDTVDCRSSGSFTTPKSYMAEIWPAKHIFLISLHMQSFSFLVLNSQT